MLHQTQSLDLNLTAVEMVCYLPSKEIQGHSLPIALRKGTISCIQHPIAHSLSYDRLSTKPRAFSSSLSSIKIPRTVEVAMKDKHWMQAMKGEMQAEKRNQHGILYLNLKECILLVTNGSSH